MLPEHGMAGNVIPLIESATVVLAAAEIASAKPTIGVAFGAEDLSADIGATRTDDGLEVLHARETVVFAAAATLVVAIDTVYTDFEDDEGLETDTRFATQLGFDGNLAIHHAQVEPINRAFSPDRTGVEWQNGSSKRTKRPTMPFHGRRRDDRCAPARPGRTHPLACRYRESFLIVNSWYGIWYRRHSYPSLR